MSDMLEKVKSFCRAIGGRVEEYNSAVQRVVTCILPRAKRLIFTNSSGLITFTSEDDGVTQEFDVGRIGFHLDARNPKHEVFDKSPEGWSFTAFVLGDFDRFRATYRKYGGREELRMSFWREEE